MSQNIIFVMQNLGIDVNIVVSKLEGKKPAKIRTTFKT